MAQRPDCPYWIGLLTLPQGLAALVAKTLWPVQPTANNN